jgi:hypothetical protein
MNHIELKRLREIAERLDSIDEENMGAEDRFQFRLSKLNLKEIIEGKL